MDAASGRLNSIRQAGALRSAQRTGEVEMAHLKDGRIRILDLLTGKEELLKPETADSYDTLAWFPDGSGLIYSYALKTSRILAK